MKAKRNHEQVVYRRLTEEFNGDELQELAFEFTGKEDVIFTEAFTLEQRAIALVTYAVRRGRLAQLIDLIEQKRD